MNVFSIAVTSHDIDNQKFVKQASDRPNPCKVVPKAKPDTDYSICSAVLCKHPGLPHTQAVGEAATPKRQRSTGGRANKAQHTNTSI